MSGASIFDRAVAGEALAFAPIVWTDLPKIVHQEGADWWLNPATAQRLMTDAAKIAGADAMFVRCDDLAVSRALKRMGSGDEQLESFEQSEEVRALHELCTRIIGYVPFAVVVSLPCISFLETSFHASEREVAEDVLVNLARIFLETGIHALAFIGDDKDDLRESVRHAATVASFFGRPVCGFNVAGDEFSGWVEGKSNCPVAGVSKEGSWPAIDRGIVTTKTDISGHWDAQLLREAGRRRP